jgi:hypothetical protein
VLDQLLERVYAPLTAARMRPVPGDAALPHASTRCSIASTNASTLPLIGFYTPSASHLLRPETRTKFSFMPS